jgi:hypothetical protein
MKTISIVALTIGMINAADAHCYSRWYYPYPQKCGGVYSRQSNRPPIIHRVDFSPPLPPDNFDIPLPDLSANWGGTLDTQLELQLRLRALGYQTDR